MHFIPRHGEKSIICGQRIGLSICVALLLADPVAADDWPFFRGPHANGVSTESAWTSHWPDAGPRIAWCADAGVGVSSVVVAKNHVVTMGSRRQPDEEIVWCFDPRNGDVLWHFSYFAKFDARQFEGGPAATPTIDDGRVYTLGYLGDLHCLNLADGRVVWRKHLVRDLRGRYSSWKYAGSPLVTEKLIILDAGANGNSTVALDKATGRKVWNAGNDLAGYSTPIPFRHSGRHCVLVFKARALLAHDLASGEELWRIDWRTTYDCNASCPTVVGDKLFLSTGYGGRRARGALYRLGRGEPIHIWLNQDLETRMNSAVVYNGHVYCISERATGQLVCCNLRDGSVVWSEPSFAKFGTLMLADGKLIILDEKGELVIAEATGAGYHELARAKVLDGRSWVMPVLANGRIYAKNNDGKIVCVDVRANRGE
jgi:outer membrane protein assembly factor BamB